jgi:hypothetical protein
MYTILVNMENKLFRDGLVWIGFMVFNATFNNISVIPVISETTDLPQGTDKLDHTVIIPT